MALGDKALVGNLSYVGIGRELTFGTYNTCTAGFSFLSCSPKLTQDTKILEEIQTSRTNSNAIKLGVKLEIGMEGYFLPKNLAANYLLQNAFGGGPVSSATATGETAGGGGFTHTINIANFDQTYSSLCMNVRKGDSATGKIFEYSGIRVDELTFKAAYEAPLSMSIKAIGKDASTTSNDVASALTNAGTPLSYVNGRLSIEAGGSALWTTTSYWNVQAFEFKLSNNLMGDKSSRRIGSDTLQVLPAGLAQFSFKATVRYDTLTSYQAMRAGTRMSGQFEFLGDTMTGSVAREGIKLSMPYLLVIDSGDPEIGGPNDVLSSEVTFAVLRDPTSSGYAVKAEVTNATSSYA